jgi:predicted ABC-type ATPase
VTEPNPDVPFLLIIAGPNGAGKSSHWDREYRSRKLQLPYVNADEIARSMSPSETRDRDAMFEAEKKRREHIERRESFAFETVFSHPGKLEEIQLAKEAGYYIRLVFIGLASPQLSVARVMRRVARGGHAVPPEKIPGRYARNLQNLAKAVPLVDEAVICDNSAEDQKPIEILEFHNGKLLKKSAEIPDWVERTLGDFLKENKPAASAGAKAKKPALRRTR